MALPDNEQQLMDLRKQTIAAINKKGGKDKASKQAQRLREIDSKLSQIRTTNRNAPTPTDGTAPRTGAPQPTDPSAGGATIGIGTNNLPPGTPAQLLEGLDLGRALYPDGSLGRMPNPAPIGKLGAYDKIQMIDVNGVPRVNVIDTSKIPSVREVDSSGIPQVKEISTARDEGLADSIGKWEDYYNKTQQRDQYIDAALKRSGEMADKGYSTQDMQAKRASANREIDAQSATALRNLRNSQGAAGAFGGVAAARQKNLTKDALLRKAMNESDLLSKDADFRLNANAQAGNLANQAFQTYNTTQQAGLSGLTGARSTSAQNVLTREMANQDAQGRNQGAAIDVAGLNLDAQKANQTNYIEGERVRGQQEGTNANNTIDVLKSNQDAQGANAQTQTQRDIVDKQTEAANIAREQETIRANMEQNEKEKAGQLGIGFGYWQTLDANEKQKLIDDYQNKLLDNALKGV